MLPLKLNALLISILWLGALYRLVSEQTLQNLNFRSVAIFIYWYFLYNYVHLKISELFLGCRARVKAYVVKILSDSDGVARDTAPSDIAGDALPAPVASQ